MTRITSGAFRLAALLLVLVLSLALFAGCKGEDNNVSKKDSSKVTTSIDNTEIVDQYKDKDHERLPETLDLGGFEMTFATPSPTTIIPEAGVTAEGDLKLEQLRQVQDNYNCVITIREVAETGWNEAMTAIVAGEQFANVLLPCVHQAGGFIQSRLCADFLDPEISQYIDQNDPWWNDTMAYASNILGKVYAGASTIQNPASTTWVVYFNKKIAEDIGIGENELYDLWKKGDWNWDAFVKYAKMAVKDQDGSGKLDSEEDRWGFVAPGYDCIQAFASSAKVASVTTTDGMNPTYTFNTPHAITTITRLNQIFTTDGIYCLSSWNNSSYKAIFGAGNSLFACLFLGWMSGNTLRTMEDDWGLLPIPKGPKESGGWQDKYLSRVDHNFRLCLIPSTVEDKASTALVLEALSYKYFQIINDEIEVMAISRSRDDESIEVANTIYNTSSFEISQFLYSINNGSWNAQVETKMRDVVSIANYDVSGSMMGAADLAQQMINDYFNGVT